MLTLLTIACLLLAATGTLAHDGGAIPADVWTHWNTDPLILTVLVLPLYLYLRGAATYRVAGWRTAAFASGIAVLFAALISPLDALSATLFSSHMIQHLLFVMAAAPLLVFSRPLASLLRGLPLNWRKASGQIVQSPTARMIGHSLTQPVPVSILHLAVLWLWHIPALYSAAIEQPVLHFAQHASYFMTAVLFWWMLVNTPGYGSRILAVFVMMMATGLLGALMTFAREPWYRSHAPYVGAWGLAPLEDQQLAGLFMWIPPGFIFVVTAGLLLGGWLNSVEQRVVRRERQLVKEMNDV